MKKRDAVWICRRMMKIWHPEFRGDVGAKQKYWTTFLDILYEQGNIDKEDHSTWSCPFK